MTTIDAYRRAAASEIASLLARLEGLSPAERDFSVARFGERLSTRHPEEVDALKEAALDALRELPGRLAYSLDGGEAGDEAAPASLLRRIFAALAYAVEHPRPAALDAARAETLPLSGPVADAGLPEPDWDADEQA